MDRTNKIKIKPVEEIDEQLFLLYKLENLYEEMNQFHPESGEIEKFKKKIQRFLDYIGNKDFDPKITALYYDLSKAADLYVGLIVKIGEISGEAQSLAEKETDTTPNFTGHPLLDMGAYLIEEIWQSSQNAQTANEAARKNLEKALEEFNNKYQEIEMRAQNIALELTEKRGWQAGEAGLDISSKQREEIGELFEKKDFHTIARIYKNIKKRRPRDPFVVVRYHTLLSLDAETVSSEDLMTAAQENEAAVFFIPPSTIYGEDCALCFYAAGWLALQAADKEAEGKQWGAFKNSAADYALRLFAAREEFVPFDTDANGEIRYFQAVASALNGQFNEAYSLTQQIKELYKDNPNFAEFMAYLSSNLEKNDDAFYWFKRCVSEMNLAKDAETINKLRTEPNLNALCQAKPEDFKKLLTLNSRIEVKHGFIWDKVVLTNKSSFPITNVRLRGNFIATKNQEKVKVSLDAERIEPGEDYGWGFALSIPGDNYDREKSSVVMNCDQGKNYFFNKKENKEIS